MQRNRQAAAVLCIALLIVAAVLPAVAATVGTVVLVPLWTVEPAISVTNIRHAAARCDEQPVAFLSTLASRAPPTNPL
jgi:hypothetical protein